MLLRRERPEWQGAAYDGVHRDETLPAGRRITDTERVEEDHDEEPYRDEPDGELPTTASATAAGNGSRLTSAGGPQRNENGN